MSEQTTSKKATKKKASKKTASKKTASKKATAKADAEVEVKSVAESTVVKTEEDKPAAKPKAKASKKANSRIKVTLVRSPIGCIGKHRLTVHGLGLRRMHQTVELEDTPAIRGMVNKVRYLVRVEAA